MSKSVELGIVGETLAKHWLQAQGYTLCKPTIASLWVGGVYKSVYQILNTPSKWSLQPNHLKLCRHIGCLKPSQRTQSRHSCGDLCDRPCLFFQTIQLMHRTLAHTKKYVLFDFIGHTNHTHHLIEVKTNNGHHEPQQLIFLQASKQLGYVATLVHVTITRHETSLRLQRL